ncbi:MAG: hypothetical protein WKF41_02725 [Gaiellaceae bacterium]
MPLGSRWRAVTASLGMITVPVALYAALATRRIGVPVALSAAFAGIVVIAYWIYVWVSALQGSS